jgi:hypothetical protein
MLKIRREMIDALEARLPSGQRGPGGRPASRRLRRKAGWSWDGVITLPPGIEDGSGLGPSAVTAVGMATPAAWKALGAWPRQSVRKR